MKDMICYLAPLEEVTGYIYRNALAEVFGGADKYFTPFIAPTEKRILKTREKRDVDPSNNKGIYVVPQILTAKPEEFVETSKLLDSLGYKEINFNAGCPSGTVTGKGKGAGFLKDTYKMVKFLDAVFESLQKENLSNFKVSVKTRIGVSEAWEFEDIIDIYNRFPFEEVIVHGRLMTQVYKGQVDIKSLAYAVEHSQNKVCLNGDIVDSASYENIKTGIRSCLALSKESTDEQNYVNQHLIDEIPVMIGRGAIANPGIFRQLKGGEAASLEELKLFHDKVYEGYCEIFSPKDALFKMKEVWFYMGARFEKSEKSLKGIRKTAKPDEYLKYVEDIFGH